MHREARPLQSVHGQGLAILRGDPMRRLARRAERRPPIGLDAASRVDGHDGGDGSSRIARSTGSRRLRASFASMHEATLVRAARSPRRRRAPTRSPSVADALAAEGALPRGATSATRSRAAFDATAVVLTSSAPRRATSACARGRCMSTALVRRRRRRRRCGSRGAARGKSIDPGRLDNLVGGGIAAGEAADADAASRSVGRSGHRRRRSPHRRAPCRACRRCAAIAARRPAARDDLRLRPWLPADVRAGEPGRRSGRASLGVDCAKRGLVADRARRRDRCHDARREPRRRSTA